MEKQCASTHCNIESCQEFYLAKVVKAANKNGVKCKEIIKMLAVAYVYDPVESMGMEIEYIQKAPECLPWYLRAYTIYHNHTGHKKTKAIMTPPSPPKVPQRKGVDPPPGVEK